jgi:hypothetical protein
MQKSRERIISVILRQTCSSLFKTHWEVILVKTEWVTGKIEDQKGNGRLDWLGFVASRIMASQRCPLLILRTGEYIILCGKWELRLQMDAIWWPGTKEIILDYLSRPKLITRILKHGKRRQKGESQTDGSVRKVWADVAGCQDRESGLWAKEIRWVLEAGKCKDIDSPWEEPVSNIALLIPSF